MTSSEGRPDGQKSTLATWRTRIIGGLALLAVVVITYLILAAFIPRWWAQRVGDTVGKSFSKGIAWGLAYGWLGTLVPLLLLLFAALIWRRRAGKFAAGAAAVIAIVLAIPNLMTLSVVRGSGSASDAGRQIMNVEAPAFRGATLAGAIAAVILFLLVVALVARRRIRRRKAAEQLTRQPPPASPSMTATRPGNL
ncbi:permease [Nocardia sp. NPDC050710]|uniref:permease n=1 Tax=Nocardia sp. NPDC050710 TaxID=3157220 RepID=UPI0033E1ACD5